MPVLHKAPAVVADLHGFSAWRERLGCPLGLLVCHSGPRRRWEAVTVSVSARALARAALWASMSTVGRGASSMVTVTWWPASVSC